MINNQQRNIINTKEPLQQQQQQQQQQQHHHHGGLQHQQSISSKPSLVSASSSIDSDVSDRRDVREALYTGIFRRHRKTILVLGSFLKMLKMNRNVNNYASIKANEEQDE
ncbi:ras guanine nucleotide exchange factor Q [Leptopilina heterotoma]|uniref:ras guanine nucleotide exchange factor Q n=1 Tax=Leptopilina heterotoma TaxID=63436 RepID=UPI001CA8B341|nr:ras guanine nucleotide exchange factor Q [Leptopilina heterotoma]